MDKKKSKKFNELKGDDASFNSEEPSEENIENKKKRKVDNIKKNKSIKKPIPESITPINKNNPFLPLTSSNNLDPKTDSFINSPKNSKNINDSTNLDLNQSDLDLIFEEDCKDNNLIKISERPKISNIYYINGNKLTVKDLKDGRRIFNNKTEFLGYSGFRENFLEFRQLLFENLLLNEDFSENLKEKWTMESAIFSTFCYDAEFIEPLIKKFNIKSLIIKEGGNFNNGQHVEEVDKNITFIHPKLDNTMKWGKFHSKLTIFKFPDFIRVIIPSANLTNGDWYYWGQIVWFQDFYRKKQTNADLYGASSNLDSDFEIYLEKVFKSKLPKGFKDTTWYKGLNLNLSDYDYSYTCVDLVASASGRHPNENKHDFGLGRLKHLTELYTKSRLSLKNSLNRLTVQCSSIGKSLKEKFLSDFCEGFLCRKKEERYNIDIIYPTVDYVDSFQLGRDLSGCLFLNKETFLMHKYKFKKFEVIPEIEASKTIFHSKFFISSEGQIDPDNISDNMLLYFGSHNFSIAAWGSFEKNDSQVSMANYELGILFNPIKLRFEEKQKIVKSLLINLNSGYYSNLDEAWIFDSI